MPGHADFDFLQVGQLQSKQVAKSAANDNCASHFYNARERLRRYPIKMYVRNPRPYGGLPGDPPGPDWVFNMTDAEERAAQQTWWTAMRAERARLDAHIHAHLAEVASGKELAVFSIFAHGSSCSANRRPPTNDCGWWSTGIDMRGLFTIERSASPPSSPPSIGVPDLEPRLYDAAWRNVCEHVVADSSCFAGCSVKLGKNLNQARVANCSQQTASDCCNRAGWRGNAWVASASEDDECWYFGETVGRFERGPDDVMIELWKKLDQDAKEGKKHELIRRLSFKEFSTSYSDPGYHACCK